MTSSNDFPTTGLELRYLLVASDYARSLAFYRDVLGAKVVRQISDVLCLLSLGGNELLLTVGGGPTQDKPTVTFAPPTDPETVSSELNMRVPDCVATYELLRSRGAKFLTPPEEYCSGTPQRHVNPYRHFTLDLTQRLLLSLTQIALTS